MSTENSTQPLAAGANPESGHAVLALSAMTSVTRSGKSVDPGFIEQVLRHRGPVDEHSDHWSSEPIKPGIEGLKTPFQLQFGQGACEALWPAPGCLFSVMLRNDETSKRRLFVWQGEGFLVCGVAETTVTKDVLAGHFFSSADPFVLDQQSEMHAIGYHRLAQRMVIKDAVEVLAPLASFEMGLDLGKALATRMGTSAAEQFLDGLVKGLLPNSMPKKPKPRSD
jgi:hypothetical protein